MPKFSRAVLSYYFRRKSIKMPAQQLPIVSLMTELIINYLKGY